MITEEKKKEMEEKFTKYEIARILGARALQLAMNAPILAKLSDEQLRELNYDSFKIAEVEFYSGILPITVKRPFPIKKEEKIIVEKKIEKREKITKEAEEKKEGEEIEEGKIIKEIEGAEIMEIARPSDEAEEVEEGEEE